MQVPSTTLKTKSAGEKQAKMAIWLFSSLTGLFLLVGAGKVLVFVFPASAFAVGLFVYFRAPLLYIGFAWWLFFLSNFIRRLIDYQAGYVTFGPWGLASTLVMLISGITFYKKLPTINREGGLPFALSVFAILYAASTGFLLNSKRGVVLGTLDWLCPVLFGFHIYSLWRSYPDCRKVIQNVFFWGVIIMGSYGIFQYITAPVWEKFWLNNISAVSFGQPEPFGIRIPSTMGSPQGFGITMLAGLILLFCKVNNLLVFFATGVGYLSFFLTMARTAWLSGIVGIPLFLASLKPNIQMRMIIFTFILILVVVQVLAFSPFSEDIYSRFDTFTDIQNDNSYEGRLSGYEQTWSLAIRQFMGQGFGFPVSSFVGRLGGKDSTIFPMLFSLGWFGAVPYISGIVLLMFNIFYGKKNRSDTFINGTQVIILSILIQSPLNMILGGPPSVLLWSFLGIGAAAQKYYSTNR